MNGAMVAELGHLLPTAVCAVAGLTLVSAGGRWAYRTPGATLLVAQILLAAAVSAVLGTVAVWSAVAAWSLGAVLILATAVTAARWHRWRRRIRRLVDLVATPDDEHPGVAVVVHDAPSAYCLPGTRARVVVTTGARRLLSPGELAAVLDHERRHAHARHDLALLPFAVVAGVLPLPPSRRLLRETQLLVEMCADQGAARRGAAAELRSALARLAATPAPPAGVLSAAAVGVEERIARLDLPPAPFPHPGVMLLGAAAVTLFSTPLSLLAWRLFLG